MSTDFSTEDNRMVSLKGLGTAHIFKVRNKKAAVWPILRILKIYYEGIINNPMKGYMDGQITRERKLTQTGTIK